MDSSVYPKLLNEILVVQLAEPISSALQKSVSGLNWQIRLTSKWLLLFSRVRLTQLGTKHRNFREIILFVRIPKFSARTQYLLLQTRPPILCNWKYIKGLNWQIRLTSKWLLLSSWARLTQIGTNYRNFREIVIFVQNPKFSARAQYLLLQTRPTILWNWRYIKDRFA